MVKLLSKLWNYSPAQLVRILRNKYYAPVALPKYPIDKSELARLNSLPRYIFGKTDLLGKTLEYVDARSYMEMLDEIFYNENYKFDSLTEQPVIIDCGSNIGLSVIYFKSIYPESRIVAFEPDKNIFQVLSRNITEFAYRNVELHEKAVWISNEDLNFDAEGSWGGKVDSNLTDRTMLVKAVRLKDYLKNTVDFLKIDIEGGETDVIVDCAELLVNVRNLFVEYHSTLGQVQSLDVILRVISKAGFRYHIKEAAIKKRPFIDKVAAGFDSQLEIYAYRQN